MTRDIVKIILITLAVTFAASLFRDSVRQAIRLITNDTDLICPKCNKKIVTSNKIYCYNCDIFLSDL